MDVDGMTPAMMMTAFIDRFGWHVVVQAGQTMVDAAREYLLDHGVDPNSIAPNAIAKIAGPKFVAVMRKLHSAEYTGDEVITMLQEAGAQAAKEVMAA